MAFDEDLAERIRFYIDPIKENFTEKKMFGGLCFFLRGNMLCGVGNNGGMFRVGKENEATAMALPHAKPFDVTGRKMGSMVSADEAVFTDDAAYDALLALAVDFVAKLPAK